MELNKLLVAPAIILILTLEGWWCSGCWENERIALLQLKTFINFPNGTSLSDWGIDKTDCCKWSGVACDDSTRRVTELDLGRVRNEKLGDWYINASLFLPFQKLNSLYLYENQIVGGIKNEGFEKLSRLVLLETLDLYYNNLNNSILSSLNAISSLKLLYLTYNRVKGSIDIQGLDALTKLKELHLSENAINEFVYTNKSMPSKVIGGLNNLSTIYLRNVTFNRNRISLQTLGIFPNLKSLWIGYNNFEGTKIIQELHTLRNLEELYLDGSSIDGNFLSDIRALNSLKILSLWRCKLNNTFPNQGWCELKKLEELDLSWNKFEGTLPSCLGSMSNLRVLDISNNTFAGNIALSPLTKMASLQFLSLSNNNFQIPASFNSFANLSNLKVLFIDGNKLIAGPNVHAWNPNFQLQIFSMSNCTSENKSLPNFLYHQYYLRIIDLSSNNFSGIFPSWLLKNNTKLELVSLKENFFTGPFELPTNPNINLSMVDISNNKMQCQIPENMGEIFPNLRHLNMSENSFQGSIPYSFGNMSSLGILDLSSNNLSGGIPQQLALGCFNLQYLKLSNNILVGEVLPKNSNLTSLRYMYLDNNSFSGNLPDLLSSIDIQELELSDNQFYGELPRWLGKMKYLKRISLSNNDFAGPIPIELCNLEHLRFLDLSLNNLSASIPSCFSSLPIIQVHLNGNKLSGRLGPAFSNCSAMVTLDLSDNNLTGAIPNLIGSNSSLSILLLRGNRFVGEIPIQLCQLKELSIIDLSKNYLYGPISGCLSNLTFNTRQDKSYLSYEISQVANFEGIITSYVGLMAIDSRFHLFRNLHYSSMDVKEQIKLTTKRGSYAYKGRVLRNMSGIDLSDNQLTGKVPSEIGCLSEIISLNLSHNYLSGPIPATFSNLKHIESLDLSCNNFSGRIPHQLTKLTFLSSFSVAHNDLSGQIPDMKAQFSTFDESTYEGNPLLCGPPLNHSCSKIESQSPIPAGLNAEEEDGFVDKDAFWICFAVSYTMVLLAIAAVLCINPYWRLVWFYYVEICVTICCYFVVDSFYKLSRFRIMWPCV